MACKSLQLKTSLVLLFSAMLLISCEEQLEEEVYSSFTSENFYQDLETAELGMWGIYDILGSINTYGELYPFYFHIIVLFLD